MCAVVTRLALQLNTARGLPLRWVVSGRPSCENDQCMIHSGATYKVYDPTDSFHDF